MNNFKNNYVDKEILKRDTENFNFIVGDIIKVTDNEGIEEYVELGNVRTVNKIDEENLLVYADDLWISMTRIEIIERILK